MVCMELDEQRLELVCMQHMGDQMRCGTGKPFGVLHRLAHERWVRLNERILKAGIGLPVRKRNGASIIPVSVD